MRGRRLFLFLYLASGAAALVYEVVWTRLLTLQLGHTVAAASTVLAAFMGGLASGAWIAGRILRRGTGRGSSSPATCLRVYAGLEIGIALFAVLLPSGLHAFGSVLAWAYADGTAPARFAIVRVGISLAVLGVPTAAMGATFPIAAQWWAETQHAAARSAADTGLLYAVNTAGAALGAIAAGFFLIPSIGLRATTGIGVALNLVAAGGASWLAANSITINAELAEHAEPTASYPKKKKSLRAQRVLRLPSSSPRIASPKLASAVAGISGFTALVYEVAWTRLLVLVIGPTTYAFATMAAAFISGIAIGSTIGTRIARHTLRPGVWLALTLAGGNVAAAGAAAYAATRMPLAVAAQVADPAVVFGSIVTRQAIGVGLLLLPMTFALGATFPLALAVAGGTASNAGHDASRLYTANTVGAIGGALCAGFLLIPQLGLQMTVAAAAWVGALAGATCLTMVPAEYGKRRLHTAAGAVALAGIAIGAIAAFPAWDRELLAGGGYKYAPYIASGDVETMLRAGRLEYYKEGAAGTVSVRRLNGTLSLAIDGKVDASNAGDMLTQRLLGLLPVVLHGRAADICIIGLGSGVTVGSALLAGSVRHADVVEISPEVVEASHWFDAENGRALAQPSVRLIIGDGRSHLLSSPRQYDVVISEPSNPWMAGVATLFTREFFEAARRRLRADGLLCQWAHTYDISADDLQSIVRTFASVFPQGTMWLVGEGDLLLIGPNGADILPRIDRSIGEWPRGRASAALSALGIQDRAAAFDFLSLLSGGPREIAQYAGSALIQTDDRTALEYSAPRGIYGRTSGENAAAIRALAGTLPQEIRAVLDRADDASWGSRGAMLLKAEAFALAYDAFRRAVSLNRENADALAGLSNAAAGAHREMEERDWLTALAAREPRNAAVRIELSRVLAAAGDFEAAMTAADDALRLAPDEPRAAEQLASVLADAGDGNRLAPFADALVKRFPERPSARYYLASSLFLQGKTDDAIREARRVVEAAPGHAQAQNLLGAACATLGHRDCALTAFEASIRANPRDPSTYVNLGMFHLQSADPQSASDAFAEALAVDPMSAAARDGLAQARSLMAGNPR
jgi:spermidine synthase